MWLFVVRKPSEMELQRSNKMQQIWNLGLELLLAAKNVMFRSVDEVCLNHRVISATYSLTSSSGTYMRLKHAAMSVRSNEAATSSADYFLGQAPSGELRELPCSSRAGWLWQEPAPGWHWREAGAQVQ